MPKGLPVDAVRVNGGSGSIGSFTIPGWLQGRLAVESEGGSDEEVPPHPQPVKDGDYLVHHGGGVIDVIPNDAFHAKYKAVRNRKQEAAE